MKALQEAKIEAKNNSGDFQKPRNIAFFKLLLCNQQTGSDTVWRSVWI